MKHLMYSIALFSLFSTMALATPTIEISSPEVLIQCSGEAFGAVAETTQVTDVALEKGLLKIRLETQLLVCDKEGNTFAFKKVNPYEGFQVPYFDYEQSKIKYRFDFLDKTNKTNRIVMNVKSFRHHYAVEGVQSEGKITAEFLLPEEEFDNDVDFFMVGNFTTLIDGQIFKNSIENQFSSARLLRLKESVVK